MPTDFYDVLGAPADASSEELKRAYRGRVREYHPDVNDHPESDAQFKLIRKAHDVLSNAAERKDYDRMGHREYAEKRLDDIPPLTVFPDLADEEPDSSDTDTATVDSSGSVSTESNRTDGSSTTSTSSSTSRSASNQSSRRSSTSSSRTSKRSQSGTGQPSESSQSSSTGRSTESSRSTRKGQSAASNQSNDGQRSRQTGSSTRSSQTGTSDTSTDSTSASAETSGSSWDDVTEQTARSRSTQSSTTATAARRRRGLRRWYGVVLLSLLAYLAGIWTYAAPYADTLSGLARGLSSTPVATLTGTFPLPSPTAFVLGTVTAATSGEPGVGLLFLVGAVALPAVVLTAVAQFGHGSAWIYGLASLGPAIPFAAEQVAPLSTAIAVVGLLVLPVFSGLGFLVDVGRYLWATR